MAAAALRRVWGLSHVHTWMDSRSLTLGCACVCRGNCLPSSCRCLGWPVWGRKGQEKVDSGCLPPTPRGSHTRLLPLVSWPSACPLRPPLPHLQACAIPTSLQVAQESPVLRAQCMPSSQPLQPAPPRHPGAASLTPARASAETAQECLHTPCAGGPPPSRSAPHHTPTRSNSHHTSIFKVKLKSDVYLQGQPMLHLHLPGRHLPDHSGPTPEGPLAQATPNGLSVPVLGLSRTAPRMSLRPASTTGRGSRCLEPQRVCPLAQGCPSLFN